ncbi:MAG: alkaline phosphatase [Victivallaceae bacterium]|nr:alkaline phosphatase [Victivallaceae bacterium]
MKKILFVLLVLPLLTFASDQVKYIFLFIGDGMGMAQRMAADRYKQLTIGEGLLMNTFPVQGITTTWCADHFITDSAASGTAIACGTKTNTGVLGLDADGNRLESVAEMAKIKGRKVGIISSVSLNNATPAAFYAHNPSRSNLYDISLDLLNSNFDFFGGGSFSDLDGKNSKNARGNFLDLARADGYTVTTTREQFDALDKLPAIAISPKLDGDAMPFNLDMEPGDLTLADITAKAIDLLDNDNGFFIMIEGGKIDWCGHANDIGGNIGETIGMDNAIQVAYDFALRNPDDTLIVVTADHETGGLALGYSGTHYESNIDRVSAQKAAYTTFGRAYANLKKDTAATFDDIKPLVTQYFSFKFEGDDGDPLLLKDYEVKKLEEGFKRSREAGTYSPVEVREELYNDYDPFVVELYHLTANRAGLAWTTYSHTAIPVVTSAYGEESDEFEGMTDNTDMANTIKTLL